MPEWPEWPDCSRWVAQSEAVARRQPVRSRYLEQSEAALRKAEARPAHPAMHLAPCRVLAMSFSFFVPYLTCFYALPLLKSTFT